MNKFLFSSLTLGFAAFSSASLNFNVDQEILTTSPGGTVTFSGTIFTSAGWDMNDFIAEFPSNGISTITNFSFDVGFSAYLNLDTSASDSTYAGNIISFTVNPSAPLGLYDLNNGPFGSNPLSECIAYATNASRGIITSDQEMIGVNVVPEPSSMVALGVGAVAFVRRRKRG